MNAKNIDKHIQEVRPDAHKGLYRAGYEAALKKGEEVYKAAKLLIDKRNSGAFEGAMHWEWGNISSAVENFEK